jgi:hypothetical protein
MKRVEAVLTMLHAARPQARIGVLNRRAGLKARESPYVRLDNAHRADRPGGRFANSFQIAPTAIIKKLLPLRGVSPKNRRTGYQTFFNSHRLIPQ